MNRFFSLMVLLISLVLPSLAWGHGDSKHILGTVVETTQHHVVVKTTKGESVSINFRSNTNFQQNGINSKDARPQAGDRLIAEVSKDGETFVASEIRFSTTNAKKE